jgi:hypothetical protein
MGSKTTPFCSEPTETLRTRDGQRLAAELGRYIAASDQGPQIDDRDVMVGLALYYDCAERLDIEPIHVFGSASRSASAAMRATVMIFARCHDVTLKAFGWRLLELPDGPCYRPAERGLAWQSRRSTRPPNDA